MICKLVILLCLHFVFVFATRENIVINLPELDESQLNFNGNFEEKLSTLEYLLYTLSENSNVTLIGWERTYKKDGTLSGIKAIELSILTEMRPQQSLSLDHVSVYSELYVLQDLVYEFDALGISLGGSFNQYDADGGSASLIEVELNNVKVYDTDTDSLDWKHTITEENLEAVQNFVSNLNNNTQLPVALLHWDTNGDFDSANSNIVPEAVSVVYTAMDANVTVLETVLEAFYRGTIVQSQNVSSQISEYLIEKIPEYRWLVTSDTISSSVDYQVYLEVANTMDVLTADVYYIYGI